MKKILTALLFVSFLCGGLLFLGNTASAATDSAVKTKFDASLKGTGKLAGYKEATANEASEFGLMIKIGQAVKVILSLVGVVFLLLMIYGGHTWMLAQGDSSEVEIAKKTIEAAIIGLIIVLAAYAITSFISQELVAATTATAEETP